MSEDAITFEHVDVLFTQQGETSPRRPGRQASRLQAALAACDAGADRDEVTRTHGVTVAVRDATLAVRRGEFVVLMGLSGAGKSTLLRCVNGLAGVARGHVWVEHDQARIDVASCPPEILRRLRLHRIAMVFQQFALIPSRTVRQNVTLGLEFRGDAARDRHRIADDTLALVGLSDWADRHIGELSGGMQQRVGLARALATDADILLMDEPFSALDAITRRKLQDGLQALQRQLRKTILFVTHDLDEALRLGDRIAVMQDGRIVQTGTPSEICHAPATPYVSDLVQPRR